MRLPTGEIPNICLARLAQQKATKLIFTSDQKRLSSGREKQFEEAEWIGDLRGGRLGRSHAHWRNCWLVFVLFSRTHDKILLAEF